MIVLKSRTPTQREQQHKRTDSLASIDRIIDDTMLGKLLIAVGSLLLLHAGYYSVQCTSCRRSCFSCARIDHKSLTQRAPAHVHSCADAEYVKLTEVTDAKMPPFEVRPLLIRVLLSVRQSQQTDCT